MVRKQVLPYGQWESPIKPDFVAYGSKSITAPRLCSTSGRSFFIESREAGGNTIFEIARDGVKEILPAKYSVSNAVYEYGGSLYDALPNSYLIFSSGNEVRTLNPDTGEVKLLLDDPVLRYSSFSTSSSASPWVVAIQEDHTKDSPTTITNLVVAINVETAEVQRIVTGADFYFSPQLSPDGTEIVWMEWNRPAMPFDDARIFRADWSPEDGIQNVCLLAGDHHESAAEPHWGPDGSLFFCKESGEYRQLFWSKPGSQVVQSVDLSGLDQTEFGEVRLFEGSRTYAPLSAKHVVMTGNQNGMSKLILVDIENDTWTKLVEPELLCSLQFDAIRRLDSHSFLVIGSGQEALPSLYRIDIREPGKVQLLRKSSTQDFDKRYYSKPEQTTIKSKKDPSRDIHGFLWMPRNPKFIAPEGQLPPLIISTHGGPTGHVGCGLNLRTQYFTSRGYAVLFLNYTGSTGHGRAYRRNLYGNWGIVDADDSAEFAQHLIKAGKVKPDGVSVTGASAGGYNTLQSLVRHSDTFAAGFCVSGISELIRFDDSTHKLEWDYVGLLCLPEGNVSRDEKEKVYKKRSAMFHTQDIKSPLFMLHGRSDTIVPLEQATLVTEALRKEGKVVEMIAVEDEGHMMGKPTSAKLWLEEEEKWWQKTLLK